METSIDRRKWCRKRSPNNLENEYVTNNITLQNKYRKWLNSNMLNYKLVT